MAGKYPGSKTYRDRKAKEEAAAAAEAAAAKSNKQVDKPATKDKAGDD